MQYLGEIISELGKELSQCLGIDSLINTLATRFYRNNTIIFQSNGVELCPNNDCELDGFFYFPPKKPIYEDKGWGCSDQMTGYEAKGFLLIYGEKECGIDWQGFLCNCLNSKQIQVGNECANVQILEITDDMPSIISTYFKHIIKDFQDSQPCTTLIKIDINLKVNIS